MNVIFFLCTMALAVAVEERIVRGTLAPFGSFPYQISLQILRNGTYRHICGGVLLTFNQVLTAAHCLYGLRAEEMRVVAGALNLVVPPDQYTQIRFVNRTKIHENFNINSSSFPNDIGKIYVTEPFTPNPNVQLANLPPKGAVFTNKKCIITGWGYTAGGGPASPNLMQANITAISRLMCLTYYLLAATITDNQLCLLDVSNPPGSRTSSCSGDSGGPATCDGLVAGISSFGKANCDGNFPSVYTRITSYLDWIAAN